MADHIHVIQPVSFFFLRQEYERLYDDCPMRYYDARNPYIDINAADERGAAGQVHHHLPLNLISTLILVIIAGIIV